jgi:hypothetical protein
MRERFETPENRQAQKALAKDIGRTMGWALRDLSESNAHYNNLDYFATHLHSPLAGRAAAWVEVKAREHVFGTFPTVILSAGKWVEGCRVARETGVPFNLIFRFSDGVYRYEHAAYHVEYNAADPLREVHFEWGGRSSDPRDTQDEEPVAHIPIGRWKKLDVVPEPEALKHDF